MFSENNYTELLYVFGLNERAVVHDAIAITKCIEIGTNMNPRHTETFELEKDENCSSNKI